MLKNLQTKEKYPCLFNNPQRGFVGSHRGFISLQRGLMKPRRELNFLYRHVDKEVSSNLT